jgi:hypothetical protein
MSERLVRFSVQLSEFLSAATFILPQALFSLSNCLLFQYHAAVMVGGGVV